MSELALTARGAAASERARHHLANLAAAPRPAGSDAESVARRYCAGVLARSGFSTSETSFEYSALPGRWATPLAGLGSIGALAVAGHLGARGGAWEAIAILGGTLLLGVPMMLWIARRGVLHLALGRRRAVNLRAVRGDGEPALWLVA